MKLLDWSSAEKQHFMSAKDEWGNPFAYEQNWLYLCQAMRRGGWVCRNDVGWVGIARNYLGHNRHAAVVPLAKNLAEFLTSAMQMLHLHAIEPEIIKHVSSEQLESILKTGNFSLRKYPDSSNGFYLEDVSEDRFPQVLINVESTQWKEETGICGQWLPVVPAGARLSDFRYQLRRFCRKYLSKGVKVEQNPIDWMKANAIDQTLIRWMESLKSRMDKPGRPRVHSFDSCFRQPVKAILECVEQGDEVEAFIIRVQNEPSAMWVGSKISEKCIGLYILLADTSIKNLSDFTLYLALLRAKQIQTKWVNLGGSEMESLYKFKYKAARGLNPHLTLRQVYDLEWRNPQRGLISQLNYFSELPSPQNPKSGSEGREEIVQSEDLCDG